MLIVFGSASGGCAMPARKQPTAAITRQSIDLLPSVRELPDPFAFLDGSRVMRVEEWPRRRAELAALVQAYQYGHLPPAPAAGAVKAEAAPDYAPPSRSGSNADTQPTTRPDPTCPPGASQEKYRLVVTAPSGKRVTFPLVVTVPRGDGPFGVIVRGDLCWGPAKAPIAVEVARRGYILAEFDRTGIVPDKAVGRDVGAYAAYPDLDFGALAAWAWGYGRVIDYVLTRRDVDGSRIVVTGHSRGGKTALLAGAMDQRVALTVPNNSGCGGAGCYRFQADKSEDIAAITGRFAFWFHARFGDFIGKVDRLPVDQHSVKALVAPRALLTTEALGDLWANPAGTLHTHLAAREVFAFLGAADRIAIHFRPGKHEQNLYDWQTLLEYADGLFRQKPTTRKYDQDPFPQSPPTWSWRAPGSRR
jgi:dienelactone hydrolase